MELIMPNNYIVIEQEEMLYLEGEGWLANSFAAGGGVVWGVAQAILKANAGAAIGTVTIPVIGTVSLAVIGGVAGFAYGFMVGSVSGYALGRAIERRLGWG